MKPFEEQNDILSELNPEQLEAVNSVNGPLLVLAGAGTGKTRVLTTRIAHIISQRLAMPHEILAVTFTNKAAKEMRDRLYDLVGEPAASSIWLGTFHSIAVRILRRHADRIGLRADFSIIDIDDQRRLIKQILKDRDIDEKTTPVKLIQYIIGRLKDKAIHYDSVPQSEENYNHIKVTELYQEYQTRLRALNAVDFGDLLLYNLKLFNEHDDIARLYQNRFKYILIDEYQDTNIAQYLWVRILAQEHGQLCCVGDDDQSIYGWRGAEVTNILRFDKDFPQAKVVRLERNYRSTPHILAVASGVIANNSSRHDKTIWGDSDEGEKVKLNYFYDDREEAKYIADEIERLQTLHKHSLSEIVILLRASFQTRVLEEVFNFLQIPYRIIGGTKFYERAEIKDVVSYIRLLANFEDNLAFERIINVPKRGVGASTLSKVYEAAKEQQVSYFEAAKGMVESGQVRSSKGIENIKEFVAIFKKWQTEMKLRPHTEVIDGLLRDSGYIDMWRDQGTMESKERIENIKELLSHLNEFESLSEYLEHISLVTDVDNMEEDNRVNIMTIHAAKGLEFETVFLPGWEEGIFPSARTIEENGNQGLEEERRLAYVAITRAKSRLYVSYACHRRVFGQYQSAIPSRFISEIPTSCCDSDTAPLMRQTPESSFKDAEQVADTSIFSKKVKTRSGDRVVTTCAITGKRVHHKKFGYGVVLRVEDDVAEVAFEDAGLKRIIKDYLKV